MVVYSQVSASEQPPEPFEANWAFMPVCLTHLMASEISHKRNKVMNCCQWQIHDSLVYCYRTQLAMKSVTCLMCDLEWFL